MSLRFGLRLLLLSVVVFGIFSAVISNFLDRHIKQEVSRVLRQLHETPGLTYDIEPTESDSSGAVNLSNCSLKDKKLQYVLEHIELVSFVCLDSVTDLEQFPSSFGGRAVADLTLISCEASQPFEVGCQPLRGLTCYSCSLSKAFLQGESFSALACLGLVGGQRTDVLMEAVGRIGTLNSLHVEMTDLTDVGLSHLRSLESLRTVNLKQTHVTDRGLQFLAANKSIASLDLSGTDIRLPDLQGLKILKHLSLNHTAVSDLLLPQIRSLAQLESLNLSNTSISNLNELGRVPTLKHLYLHGTRVSDEAISRFRALNPDCKVFTGKDAEYFQ
ncbi:MAG: hypothetical protein KDB14_31835 [Planctomycetales bacterium]|nr:hypothetical protein [Planctomycetales bacterium]